MSRNIKEHRRGATDKQIEQLTAQQRLFLKHMQASKGMKPTEAARQAGFKRPTVAAQKLMKNPVIAAALGKELKDRADRLGKTADDILQFLHMVLNVDVTEIFDDDGYTTMKKLKSLPPEVRVCISAVETDIKTVGFGDEKREQEFIKVKWMSKDHALELAMKHHGLLSPDMHLHVMTDKVKAQLLIELLGGIGDGNVIDADHIERLAAEE